MVSQIILKWQGKGYYATEISGGFAHNLGAKNRDDAEALAVLAGISKEKVVYLSDKPENSKYFIVHDETNENS